MPDNSICCQLCDNKCPLSSLACPKGKRFYEQDCEPYCTFCDNHCPLDKLKCNKGRSFYDPDMADIHDVDESALLILVSNSGRSLFSIRGGRSSKERAIRIIHDAGNVTHYIPQRVLQEKLRIGAAGTSEMVAYLVDQGLVASKPNPDDKRQKVLCLTPSGASLYEELITREKDMNLLAPLDKKEISNLYDSLKKLSQYWRDIEDRLMSESKDEN